MESQTCLQLDFDQIIFYRTWALPLRTISCYHNFHHLRLRARNLSSHLTVTLAVLTKEES